MISFFTDYEPDALDTADTDDFFRLKAPMPDLDFKQMF